MEQPDTSAYGPDPAQFGELYRPAGSGHRGTVVIVHGGFWRARYDLALGRPLARDLAGRGYTCWNLEYRRVGNGGGWPATLDDVAAGVDHLSTLGIDTSAVVAIGHSAGGHLAVWAAGRAEPGVAVTGVVSQAGVLDLATAARTGVGGRAAPDLLGGSPDDVPDRYAAADPIRHLPLPVPVLCLHARDDENVPFAQSTAYVGAARDAGGRAELQVTTGGHFPHIDTASPAWTAARAAVPALLAGQSPGSVLR